MSLLWVTATGVNHIRAGDIPVFDPLGGNPDHAVAEDDHPWRHFQNSPDRTFSLHTVPLHEILPRKHCADPEKGHSAACYSMDRQDNQRCADISDPDDDDPDENGNSYDQRYIHRIADSIRAGHPVPALVQGAGGGHRLAAHNEAGSTHVHVWRPDDGEGLIS